MRRQLHGVFNCRVAEFTISEAFGGAVFVDGVDMTSQCCYIDTESGFIKTYDLRGATDVPLKLADGNPHLESEWLNTGSVWHADVEALPGTLTGFQVVGLFESAFQERVLARVVRGRVELFAKESAGDP